MKSLSTGEVIAPKFAQVLSWTLDLPSHNLDLIWTAVAFR